MKPFAIFLMFVLSLPAYAFDCFERHAKKHDLPSDLLRAIALVESSGNPKAVSGPKGYEDIGLMQINTSWLSIKKTTKNKLLNDVCLNVSIASEILADNFSRYPNPWEAVGAYNAGCSRLKGQACVDARQKYAWKIYQKLVSLTQKDRQKLSELTS